MKKLYKSKNARKTMKKLEVLRKVSNSGKIFSVEFIKKDGSTRLMSCRKGVTKYLKGGKNPVGHLNKNGLPIYETVYSVNDKGYRNVKIESIRQIKGSGKTFYFNK